MEPEEGRLSAPTRFITTHDANGKAVFSSVVSEICKQTVLPSGDAVFALGYATRSFPVALNEEVDIHTYSGYLDKPPGLTISDGTVLRYVDMAPGHVSPMHRTVSLDYGVRLEGYVELVLGRLLRRGDVAIQRGTKHAWRTTSDNHWARMLFILQPCQPVQTGGEQLGEDLAEMRGVRASD